MAYVAPIHRPSSVRHALQLQLVAGERESLVLACVLLPAVRLDLDIKLTDSIGLGGRTDSRYGVSQRKGLLTCSIPWSSTVRFP
jgi:hypothetical protein